jgi:hypothetical protein
MDGCPVLGWWLIGKDVKGLPRNQHIMMGHKKSNPKAEGLVRNDLPGCYGDKFAN